MKLCKCGGKHVAKGLCSSCYHKLPRRRKQQKIHRALRYFKDEDYKEKTLQNSNKWKEANREILNKNRRKQYQIKIEEERARSYVKNILRRGN